MWDILQLIQSFESVWARVLLEHASVTAGCFEAPVTFISKL